MHVVAKAVASSSFAGIVLLCASGSTLLLDSLSSVKQYTFNVNRFIVRHSFYQGQIKPCFILHQRRYMRAVFF